MVNCWICGTEARTGEHLIKRSDLKAAFGHVSQAKPLYRNSAAESNTRLKGLNVAALKSPALLCEQCNSARSQPFDRAWQSLSRYLREKAPLKPGEIINLATVFPGAVSRSMLHVHIYFAKLFGCRIIDDSIPLDLDPFRRAFLSNVSHPNLYLAISPYVDSVGVLSVGQTEIRAMRDQGNLVVAAWMHLLDRFAVRVTYASSPAYLGDAVEYWHPNSVSKRLRVSRV